MSSRNNHAWFNIVERSPIWIHQRMTSLASDFYDVLHSSHTLLHKMYLRALLRTFIGCYNNLLPWWNTVDLCHSARYLWAVSSVYLHYHIVNLLGNNLWSNPCPPRLNKLFTNTNMIHISKHQTPVINLQLWGTAELIPLWTYTLDERQCFNFLI